MTRWLGLGLLALASVIGMALLLLGGDDQGGASTGKAAVPTATVERRDLVDRLSADGTLGYADSATVIDHLSGIVTWLPSAGAVIRPGQTLFEIDDKPVVLFDGTVPAYRDLELGVGAGPDVRQLEEGLAGLGFDDGGAMTVDSSFTEATAAAIRDWQDSLGLKASGRLELGRVVFLPGARRVTSLDVDLGKSASSASPSAPASDTSIAGGETSLVSNPAPGSTGKDDQNKGQSGSGGQNKGQSGSGGQNKKQPGAQGKGQSQPSAPSGSTSGSGAAPATGSSTGSASEPASPSLQVMTTTSTRPSVTAQLDASDQSVAVPGRTARITLPDGRTISGRIKSVGTVATSTQPAAGATTSGDSTEATVEVTITPNARAKVPNLDQAPVTVELTQEIRRSVLAVPVAALIATGDGDFAVVVRNGEQSRTVAVEPGLFAGGYVEVKGAGLRQGDRVEVPEE